MSRLRTEMYVVCFFVFLKKGVDNCVYLLYICVYTVNIHSELVSGKSFRKEVYDEIRKCIKTFGNISVEGDYF